MIRAIPDTTVIDPMDAVEFQQALNVAVDTPGLVYVRGHRGNTPCLLDEKSYEFVLGKTYQLVDGQNIGIVATGHATQWALEASEILTEKGISHSLLHVPTIKPVNEQEIADFCFAHKSVVTVENHQIVTGLGSLVSEIICDRGAGPKITRIGVPNQWAPGGTLPFIREQLGLDAGTLAQRIEGAAS